MKTKSFFTVISIFIVLFANGQNINKNLFSSSLGIGTANGKYGFMTSQKYERFMSNRFSIGIGINHMSNHRFVDSNFSMYFGENYYDNPKETEEDLTYNSISANLNLNYYLIKKNKDYLNLSLGFLANLFQKRLIQYIAKEGDLTKSHVSINSETRCEKINFQTSLEYIHFFTDHIGINSKLFYSSANGETFTISVGLSTRF